MFSKTMIFNKIIKCMVEIGIIINNAIIIAIIIFLFLVIFITPISFQIYNIRIHRIYNMHQDVYYKNQVNSYLTYLLYDMLINMNYFHIL